MLDLPVLRIALTFVVEEPCYGLPAFRGGFWRGLFGRALKALSDTSRPLGDAWPGSIRTIGFGPYGRAGVYTGLFSPDRDGVDLPPGIEVPAPFVIDALPGRDMLEPGETEMIGVTLIGTRAAEALPAVIAAFARVAEDGLGDADSDGRRGRARLAEATVMWREPGAVAPIVGRDGTVAPIEARTPMVPPAPARVSVYLASPLRIMRDGRVIGAREMTAGDVLEALVRRVSVLHRAHGPGPIAADFKALFASAHAANAGEYDLYWAEQHRWSATHRREMEMDGVVGSFQIDLLGAEALWPFLWLGQWLHAGRGTVHGLGGIRLRL